MSWTKRQIVEKAYGEIALAGYVFDLSPEELDAALISLDAMMGVWTGEDLEVGYQFGLTPQDSNLDQDSGLPLWAMAAAFKGLAIDLAGSKGKAVPRTLAATYKRAMSVVEANIARQQLQSQQFPSTMPRGAGNKTWRGGGIDRPFMTPPDTSPLQIGNDGNLNFGD